MKNYFADLHCHPVMKPFRSSITASKKTIWETISETELCNDLPLVLDKLGKAKESIDETTKLSQSNFDKCQSGNLRIVFNAIYPVERNWYHLADVTLLLDHERLINLNTCMSGFNRSYIKNVMNTIQNNLPINYFSEACHEYEYLIAQQSKNKKGKTFSIVSNYSELKELLSKDKNTIGIILNVEGGNSLFNHTSWERAGLDTSDYKEGSYDYKILLKQLQTNIIEMKSWGSNNGYNHSPFYLTFAHHFWNLLCGHSQSFKNLLLSQKQGKDLGFTTLGREAVKLLLSRDNGRRILIDVKHMSINSRRQFYKMWINEYRAKGDNFPIICSHTGISGLNSLAELEEDNTEKSKNPMPSYYNPWSINLCDEDIRIIHNSGGLIGIILNETRLPGTITKAKIDELRQPLNSNLLTDSEKESILKIIRKEYASLMLTNILYIIKACFEKSAWDIVCIGSDFDGMIDSLTGCDDVTCYAELKEYMLELLNNPESLINPFAGFYSKEEIQNLMFGYTAEELTDKIFTLNIETFLEKYFHDGYLLNKHENHDA